MRCALQNLSATRLLLLISGLLLGSTTPAHAQVAQLDCTITGEIISQIGYHDKDNVKALRDQHPDSTLALSCIHLQEQYQERPQDPKDPNLKWFALLSDDQKLKMTNDFKECKLSDCRNEGQTSTLLNSICPDLGLADCGDPVVSKRKPLATWRKAFGGTMIGVGGLTAVLGAIHLGVPLFSMPGGCPAHGLDHPCVADRFGTGGAFLGVGLALGVVGILTLTLP